MKKILAIVLALSLVFAFAACAKDDEPETTAAPTTDAFDDLFNEEPTVDSTSPVATQVAPNGEGSSEIATDAPATEAVATDAQGNEIKKPETTEEIVAYFNTAVNGVKTNAKTLTRNSSKITMNGKGTYPGVVSGILKMLGGADEFIGDQLAKNSKGKEVFTGADIAKIFPVENESYASKLTAADVKSAQIAEKDGKYVIRIVTKDDAKSTTVKHGEGHAPKAFNVVLPGVVNDNIPSIATGIVGLAAMNYPASTATIVVDPATGNVLTAKYEMNWTINFDEAGVIIPFTTTDDYVIAY